MAPVPAGTLNCFAHLSQSPGSGWYGQYYNGPDSSDPPSHAPDLRLIGSYPYPGRSARNYNTGWTATMTNESTSATESFQTWVMCQYAS
jgi:hypothetical protein